MSEWKRREALKHALGDVPAMLAALLGEEDVSVPLATAVLSSGTVEELEALMSYAGKMLALQEAQLVLAEERNALLKAQHVELTDPLEDKKNVDSIDSGPEPD